MRELIPDILTASEMTQNSIIHKLELQDISKMLIVSRSQNYQFVQTKPTHSYPPTVTNWQSATESC